MGLHGSSTFVLCVAHSLSCSSAHVEQFHRLRRRRWRVAGSDRLSCPELNVCMFAYDVVDANCAFCHTFMAQTVTTVCHGIACMWSHHAIYKPFLLPCPYKSLYNGSRFDRDVSMLSNSIS